MKNRSLNLLAIHVWVLLLSHPVAVIAQPDFIVLNQAISMMPVNVAWSPDSNRLAYACENQQLCIYDVSAKTQRSVAQLEALYIDWSRQSELLVLAKANDGRELYRVAADTYTTEKKPIPEGILAVSFAQPFAQNDDLVFITTKEQHYRFGTEASASVVYQRATTQNEVFTWSHMIPATAKVEHFLGGWLLAFSQNREELVLPLYRKPPVIAPHFDFTSINVQTKEQKGLLRVESKRSTIAYSWSPDRSNMILADDLGQPLLWTRASNTLAPMSAGEVSGYFPAWNPVRDAIFIGSKIIRSSGELISDLAFNDVMAMGYWSPSGASLAVVANGRLYLVLFPKK